MRLLWTIRIESADGEENTRHSKFWALVFGLAAVALLLVVVALAVWLVQGIIVRA